MEETWQIVSETLVVNRERIVRKRRAGSEVSEVGRVVKEATRSNASPNPVRVESGRNVAAASVVKVGQCGKIGQG